MMTVWRQIFFRLLVLVFRLLYCFSLLSFSVNFPCYFFVIFFLLFCIPLVYLWYSLIPSRVLSNHPPLSPSSPPISFRHLHPSLQLCPLPATLSPSGNSVSSGEPNPQPSSARRFPAEFISLPQKKLTLQSYYNFLNCARRAQTKFTIFKNIGRFFLCISDFFSNFAPQ